MAGLLVACSSGPRYEAPPPVTGDPALAVTADELEGDWGLASYRNETDRPRTEAEAKTACSNPYSITKGVGGGVMMHLADQQKPREVYVKATQDGQVFIGPKGKPAMQQDRRIVSFSEGVLVAEWVDPGAAERYGTMVFVRCAG